MRTLFPVEQHLLDVHYFKLSHQCRDNLPPELTNKNRLNRLKSLNDPIDAEIKALSLVKLEQFSHQFDESGFSVLLYGHGISFVEELILTEKCFYIDANLTDNLPVPAFIRPDTTMDSIELQYFKLFFYGEESKSQMLTQFYCRFAGKTEYGRF